MSASGAIAYCSGLDKDFSKYQALGNDYLIIDPSRSSIEVCRETAGLMCDRHRGVGADGVLWGPFYEDGNFRLRIFNSDGSECSKSGNGLRIFGHYLRNHRYVDQDRFFVETISGRTSIEVIDWDAAVFKAGLGAFAFENLANAVSGDSEPIINTPFALEGENLAVTCVRNGNTHFIIFDDEVSPQRVQLLGPAISRTPICSGRANVALAKVVDRGLLAVEIWEQGAGYVPASGVGACAAAWVAHSLGYIQSDVSVRMPGGTVSVAIAPSGDTYVTGDVHHIAEGTFAPQFQRLLRMKAGARFPLEREAELGCS